MCSEDVLCSPNRSRSLPSRLPRGCESCLNMPRGRGWKNNLISRVPQPTTATGGLDLATATTAATSAAGSGVPAPVEVQDGRADFQGAEPEGFPEEDVESALNAAGLATLTHTPSPLGFLGKVLERPKNEKAFLLIPVGYPADDCEVPDLERKSLDEIVARY